MDEREAEAEADDDDDTTQGSLLLMDPARVLVIDSS
jgi:hypothetical protein